MDVHPKDEEALGASRVRRQILSSLALADPPDSTR